MASRSGSMVSADDLPAVDGEQRRRGGDPADQGHVGGLVAEVAEVHRQRRLAGARDADQDDVGVDQPVGGLAVVVPDGELHRGDPLEVVGVEADLTRRHPLGPVAAGGLEARAGPARAGRSGRRRSRAQSSPTSSRSPSSTRVEKTATPWPSGSISSKASCRPSAVLIRGCRMIRVGWPDELCLGGPGHAGRGVAGRVRDHVDLDGRGRHGPQASHIGALWLLLEGPLQRPRREQPLPQAELDQGVERVRMAGRAAQGPVHHPRPAGQGGGRGRVPQVPAEPAPQVPPVRRAGSACGRAGAAGRPPARRRRRRRRHRRAPRSRCPRRSSG